MAFHVTEPGDKTSHDTVPDFEGGKGYYWMKQMRAAEAARMRGEYVPPAPYKRRRGLAEESFFGQVDRRLSRRNYTLGASFDAEGRIKR